MKEPKTIDVLLLILLGAIWGSAFFNIKIATYTYDPVTLVFLRVFLTQNIGRTHISVTTVYICAHLYTGE